MSSPFKLGEALRAGSLLPEALVNDIEITIAIGTWEPDYDHLWEMVRSDP